MTTPPPAPVALAALAVALACAGLPRQVAAEVTTPAAHVSVGSAGDDGEPALSTDLAPASLKTAPGCDTVFDGLANPFVNCGFEDGFRAWQTSDIEEPFLQLQTATSAANTSDFPGFFSPSPSEGGMVALTGFDGNGPSIVTIAQEVTLPFWTSNLLFDYRGAWDFVLGQEATLGRTFRVNVTQRPPHGSVVSKGSAGSKVLASQTASSLSVRVLTARAGSVQLDTGAVTGSVDLRQFAGKTVLVSFEWDVPESKTGPGLFQLDNVRLALPTALTCGLEVSSSIPDSTGTSTNGSQRWFRINVPAQRYAQTVDLSVATSQSEFKPLLQVHNPDHSHLAETPNRLRYTVTAMSNPAAQTSALNTYLISVRDPRRDMVTAGSQLFNITASCTVGRARSFGEASNLTIANDTVGSAGWHPTSACPEGRLGGHSSGGIARWGNPSSCTDYASAGATADILVESFQVEAQSEPSACPQSGHQLSFNYFLDLEDGPEFDRVRVDLQVNEDGTTTLLDNGARVGGLLNGTGVWQEASVSLPLLAATTLVGSAAPSIYSIRFLGETSDDLNNYGRGFLIDDVRIECPRGTLTLEGFESGAIGVLIVRAAASSSPANAALAARVAGAGPPNLP